MTTSTDDPLVSTDWLAARLDDPKVKIIDASFKMPGVLPLPNGRLSRRAYSRRGVLRRRRRRPIIPTRCRTCILIAEQFGRDVGGARHSAMTIPSSLYDSGGWVAAPRAWWMFLSFGHRDVRMLNGGLKKWVARRPQGRACGEVDAEAWPRSGPRSMRGYARSMQQIGRQSRKPRRAGDRCARQRALSGQGGRAAAGPSLRSYPRQPAACPTTNLFDAATGAMKPLDELRAAFLGAPASKLEAPIVTSCGSGVTALVLTLALYRLGVRGTRRCMTAHGPSGAQPTARRSRPARPDRRDQRTRRRRRRLRRERCERVGLLLLLGQRCLPRQARAAAAAIRRRSWARCSRACGALDGSLSGFATVVLPDGRVFVDDDGGTAERRDLGRGDVAFEQQISGAGGPAWSRAGCAGRLRSAMAASFTSALATGGLGSAGQAHRPVSPRWPRFAGASGSAASACIGSAGCSATDLLGLRPASFPAFSRCRVARRISGCFRNCGGGTFSGGFSPTGGSTRSSASVGGGPSFRRAEHRLGRRPSRGKVGKFLMRGAQQGGGAKPENQDRHRKHDRGEQETKAGKHGREFHPSLMSARAIDAIGNAVTTVWP